MPESEIILLSNGLGVSKDGARLEKPARLSPEIDGVEAAKFMRCDELVPKSIEVCKLDDVDIVTMLPMLGTVEGVLLGEDSGGETRLLGEGSTLLSACNG